LNYSHTTTGPVQLSFGSRALLFIQFTLMAAFVYYRSVPIDGFGSESSSVGTLLLGVGLPVLIALQLSPAALKADLSTRVPFLWHFAFLLGTAGLAYLSTLAGPHWTSPKPFLLKTIAAFFLPFAVYVAFRDLKSIQMLLSGLVLGGVVVGMRVLVVAQTLYEQDYHRVGLVDSSGVGNGSVNATALLLASAFAVGPLASIVLPTRKCKTSQRMALLSVTALTGVLLASAIVRTGTRSALLATSLAVLTVLMISWRGVRKSRLHAIALALTVALPLACWLIYTQLPESSWERLTLTDLRSEVGSWENLREHGRIASATDVTQKVFQSPKTLLLGYGMGQYSFREYRGGNRGIVEIRHIHNIFLGFAYNMGLPAALVFTYLIICAFRKLLHAHSCFSAGSAESKIVLQVILLGVVPLTVSMFSFSCVSNVFLWVFFGAAARVLDCVASSQVAGQQDLANARGL
jgi:O-antigen ligase/polysaccharide polymerase Wzy-like membrane protein